MLLLVVWFWVAVVLWLGIELGLTFGGFSGVFAGS